MVFEYFALQGDRAVRYSFNVVPAGEQKLETFRKGLDQEPDSDHPRALLDAQAAQEAARRR